MAGRSRFKESMEHFTLFLPSSYFLRLGRKLNIPVARLPKRLGSILKAVATGEKKYGEKLTELVLADARDELIEYDPGFLDRERARLKRNRQKSSK